MVFQNGISLFSFNFSVILPEPLICKEQKMHLGSQDKVRYYNFFFSSTSLLGAGCSKNGLRSELVKKEQNIHFCGS